MTTTVYVNGVTLTDAAAFNDMNNATYEGVGLGGKTTIASAASPDIFAATTSREIDYTGTVTATSFVTAPRIGASRVLLCAGAAVFTAGANMLIDGYASGNNYVARAGDQIQVVAVTTTQFRLTPLTWGNVLLATAAASNSATVDFTTGINTTFDEYLVVITNLLAATDNTILLMRLSQSASFVSSAASYAYTCIGQTDAGAPANIASNTSATFIGLNANTSNSKPLGGEVKIFTPSGTGTQKVISSDLVYQPSGGTIAKSVSAGSFILNTTACDGIRFLMNSGNITQGNFALYGVRKT